MYVGKPVTPIRGNIHTNFSCSVPHFFLS